MQRQTTRECARCPRLECGDGLAALITPFSQIFQDAAIAPSRFWNFCPQAEQMLSESETHDSGGAPMSDPLTGAWSLLECFGHPPSETTSWRAPTPCAARTREEPRTAPPGIFALALVGGEGMLGVVALGDDFGGLRLALDGAGDGLLRGGVVVVLDLGVVRSVPVNEHADADEQIVGF